MNKDYYPPISQWNARDSNYIKANGTQFNVSLTINLSSDDFMKNRALLNCHSYFGIIAGTFLIVLGITGSILLFTPDIDHLLLSKYEVETNTTDLQLDKATAAVQKWDTRIIEFGKGKTILFNLRRPEARKNVFVHPGTGNIIKAIDSNTHFTKWLLKFYYSLHSGIIGRFLVLFAGTAFFFHCLRELSFTVK